MHKYTQQKLGDKRYTFLPSQASNNHSLGRARATSSILDMIESHMIHSRSRTKVAISLKPIQARIMLKVHINVIHQPRGVGSLRRKAASQLDESIGKSDITTGKEKNMLNIVESNQELVGWESAIPLESMARLKLVISHLDQH